MVLSPTKAAEISDNLAAYLVTEGYAEYEDEKDPESDIILYDDAAEDAWLYLDAYANKEET